MNRLRADQDVVDLFTVQFLIERELRRISKHRLSKQKQRASSPKLVDYLKSIGILAPRFAALTKKLLTITPRVYNSKPLDVGTAKYVHTVGPDAISILQMMPTHRTRARL